MPAHYPARDACNAILGTAFGVLLLEAGMSPKDAEHHAVEIARRSVLALQVAGVVASDRKPPSVPSASKPGA